MSPLWHRWKFLVLMGLIAAVFSAGATFIWPLNYRADAQILVMPKTRYGVDPYTMIKSTERMGENLVEIMMTDDFFRKVRVTAGNTLDWSGYDKLTPRQQRRAWSKMVEGSMVYNTGIISVSAYRPDPAAARQLAAALSQTLVDKGWEYVGGDVILKVVNPPIATAFPVQPNPITNAGIGFIAGVLLAAFIVSKPRA
ncbi:MAG: hypothetical protein KAZ30_00250 [Candidatus Magasanikbacteria bacterium]|nr:hypothetical protein [Candidatus Magasanikbacteria bacterium]